MDRDAAPGPEGRCIVTPLPFVLVESSNPGICPACGSWTRRLWHYDEAPTLMRPVACEPCAGGWWTLIRLLHGTSRTDTGSPSVQSPERRER